MKKHVKELIILAMQFVMFYIFPMCAGPTDAMGMVLIILLSTFVLSVLMGVFSDKRMKYIYPVIAAVIFIPSVFIYYNDSALIHSVWYLVDSGIGLLLGVMMRKLLGIKKNG